MCGCSGKMNSAGEYTLRKFIAHAWDEPSGATVEVEVEGRSSPTPQALFPLYWEEQSPRICKWVWCKTSRPPQCSHVGPVQRSRYSFQTSLQTSNVPTLKFKWFVCKWCGFFFCHICVCSWGCRQWVETEKRLTAAVCSRETGKWKLSKSWSHKTNKRLTQRRENILMLIDVSSLPIGYYFHCPRTTPKAKHRLAAIIPGAIMHSSVALMLFLEWEQGAFTQPVSYFDGRWNLPPFFLFHFPVRHWQDQVVLVSHAGDSCCACSSNGKRAHPLSCF